MTTFVDFQPSQQAAFQFQPTLDSTVYSAVVTWNIFGRRYYFNLYDLSGVLVVSLPLIGSPSDADIDLVKGYFDTSTLVYREANKQFEITP